MNHSSSKVIVDYHKAYDNFSFDELFSKLKLIEKIKSANYVVIKPNFAAGTYVEANSHVVTNLKLIGQLIEYILLIDSQKIIYIAESDSTGFGFAFLKFDNLKLPESLNISETAQKNVKLLDLSRDVLIQKEDKDFRYFINFDKQLWLSKTLMGADFVIDITNLKSHSVTGFTGACKNLFGTLYPCEKWVFHTHISEVIHDLVLAIQPNLCIVDACYGMEYNGPVAGKKIDAGFRIWSTSPVAADIASCYMVDFNYMKVAHLKKLFQTMKIDPEKVIFDNKIKENKICFFHTPQYFLQMTNQIGLVIQRIGEALQYLGHRIHVTNNLLQLLVAIFRPILMTVLGRECLKKIKHMILKEK